MSQNTDVFWTLRTAPSLFPMYKRVPDRKEQFAHKTLHNLIVDFVKYQQKKTAQTPNQQPLLPLNPQYQHTQYLPTY